jgi:hypothetical protein
VDSHWTRRAAGVRRNILRVLDEAEAGGVIPSERIRLLVDSGLAILRQAAVEIPDIENLRKGMK